MKYQPVIGIEVHVELNTETKMFCRCSSQYFGKAANTHTCPICLGLPGALPFINQKAVDDCMKIGLALNCKVNKKSLFERKNYFYPDLPKGFQISQYRWPLCTGGSLEVNDKTGEKSDIRINRVHQEEDTGKLTHRNGETLADFNRSGVPLVEIVTEPDFKDSEQVKNYAKALQQLFRYLEVSNADMERGDMRLEANVSLRVESDKKLPNYRVELKNINSFRFIGQAIDYEIARQTHALENGEKLMQETRGWDEDQKKSVLQRSKEEANDYRYFPEPDLPELKVEDSRVNNLKLSLPKMPWQLEQELVDKGVSPEIAKVLSEDQEYGESILDAINLAKEKGLTAMNVAVYYSRHVLKKNITSNTSVKVVKAIEKEKSEVITDGSQLKVWAEEVVKENPTLVQSYKLGKVNVIQVLIGQVMKKSQGRANSLIVRGILEEIMA